MSAEQGASGHLRHVNRWAKADAAVRQSICKAFHSAHASWHSFSNLLASEHLLVVLKLAFTRLEFRVGKVETMVIQRHRRGAYRRHGPSADAVERMVDPVLRFPARSDRCNHIHCPRRPGRRATLEDPWW